MRTVLAILLTALPWLAGASQYVGAETTEVTFKSWVKHPVVLVTTTLKATRDLRRMSAISVSYSDTVITISPEILGKIEHPILPSAHLSFCGRGGIILIEPDVEFEEAIKPSEHPCLALHVDVSDESHKDESFSAYFSFYFIEGELWSVDKTFFDGVDWLDIEVWVDEA